MNSHPLKIVRIEIEDIIFDPKEQSAMLTHACTRHGSFRRVTGVCDCGDGTLILPLELAGMDEIVPESYRFAPIPDASFDEIAAELQVRHTNGMSLLGTFRISPDPKKIWGLYGRLPQEN